MLHLEIDQIGNQGRIVHPVVKPFALSLIADSALQQTQHKGLSPGGNAQSLPDPDLALPMAGAQYQVGQEGNADHDAVVFVDGCETETRPHTEGNLVPGMQRLFIVHRTEPSTASQFEEKTPFLRLNERHGQDQQKYAKGFHAANIPSTTETHYTKSYGFMAQSVGLVLLQWLTHHFNRLTSNRKTMIRFNNFFRLTLLCLFLVSLHPLSAQRFKDKLKAGISKDDSGMYECGAVYEPTLRDKANPMQVLQKTMGGGATGGKGDLGELSISVFYQGHIHPQGIMRYPTATPGWETCGDAVYLGMTNRTGMGLSSTDGKVMMEGQEIPNAGMGTYFQGFSPDQRGVKTVTISTANGSQAEVSIGPAAALEIKSVDGKAKGEAITIDGTKDIVIELANGDADPQSQIHISMISKLVGTPVIYDVLVTKAKNRIVIPKEAFFNYEGSPSPFAKSNTLMVNRINETVLDNTPVGAIRTLSCFMDWMPITLEGDITKGSIITAGFDTTKNTSVSIDMRTTGQYNFLLNKAGPYSAPPVKLMKKVAVASFVVRGNLEAKDVSVSSSAYTTTTTTITKWFPELDKAHWQGLADRLYAEFVQTLQEGLEVEFLPLSEITSSHAYQYTKTIQDDVSQNFVEVGAGGTKRILTTSTSDLFEDLSITFAGDFVSQRLVQELDVDAVVAVTIDLNFDFESEGLNPKVSMAFFAPNVSHKTAASYFKADASTEARSLEEAHGISGGATNQLYEMIRGEVFMQEMMQAIEQLQAKEAAMPVYEKLWQAKQ